MRARCCSLCLSIVLLHLDVTGLDTISTELALLSHSVKHAGRPHHGGQSAVDLLRDALAVVPGSEACRSGLHHRGVVARGVGVGAVWTSLSVFTMPRFALLSVVVLNSGGSHSRGGASCASPASRRKRTS